MDTPDWVLYLPTVNASLNGLATILLAVGLVLIKQGHREAHKQTMLGAFAVSVVFLGCYLVYHAYAGSKPFMGTGAIRLVYFAILISHIVLAACVPVLAIITIRRGLRQQWEAHRRIAVWTWPIWMYVSITGVVIYLMLYHWNAPPVQ